MKQVKRILLVTLFTLGFAFSVIAGINVYQCNEDGVVTTFHEDEDGFSWSIVDYNGEEPELVGSGYTTGAYNGTCPQIA